MKIDKIESLTIREVEDMRKEGKAELIIIKGHACYLVDLKGYFGYSVLVFKNNHHIHYANDYQLVTLKQHQVYLNSYAKTIDKVIELYGIQPYNSQFSSLQLVGQDDESYYCLLYTSPSPRD